jgi:hypothetical protein
MEENVKFHIKISYFEICMEKIRDLLDGNVILIITMPFENNT